MNEDTANQSDSEVVQSNVTLFETLINNIINGKPLEKEFADILQQCIWEENN